MCQALAPAILRQVHGDAAWRTLIVYLFKDASPHAPNPRVYWLTAALNAPCAWPTLAASLDHDRALAQRFLLPGDPTHPVVDRRLDPQVVTREVQRAIDRVVRFDAEFRGLMEGYLDRMLGLASVAPRSAGTGTSPPALAASSELPDRWMGQVKVTRNDIIIGKNAGVTAGTVDANTPTSESSASSMLPDG